MTAFIVSVALVGSGAVLGSVTATLVGVVANNGKEGYSYYDQVFGVPAATVDEAQSMTETRGPRQVPAYDLEGNVIGEYTAN